MPSVAGSLSDLLHPFQASQAWAAEQGGAAPAGETAIPGSPEPAGSEGTRLTSLGWLVLGGVLVGGVYLLARHAASLDERPRFGKRSG